MSDQKNLLLLIPMITAMFFIVNYGFLFSSYAYAERQSQSTSTICNGNDNSCYTTFCSDDRPCQTLPANQPDEEVTVMQPDERVTLMQPDEEVTLMQPVEVTEKYVDATLEDCDDGLDNDLDGKVDATDEECNGSVPYGSPVQGQSSDENDGEDSEGDYNEQEDSD